MDNENGIQRNLFGRIMRKVGKIWLSRKQKIWRKMLKNKDFSIICSTCVGGIIYHDLGLQFLSPTINMYMHNLDFIKFACNLKHYLSLPLNFIKTDDGFPVAMLGDIKLNFNHYVTNEEAEECWNRRKERINYENIWLFPRTSG